MGTLYIVATPIGNLEDITLRAIRTLKEVDIVFAEDTRTTKNLFNKYEIKTKLDSFNSHAKEGTFKKIFTLLEEGKNIALVSDAGTPALSDPGSILVKKIRETLPEVKVISIPGASALTATWSIAGITGNEFVFLGFLPHKKGRETLFKEIAGGNRPYIFFESSHRIEKTLDSLKKFSPDKKVLIARELTKIYEEVLQGNASEILTFLKENKEKLRGEFVVVVYN